MLWTRSQAILRNDLEKGHLERTRDAQVGMTLVDLPLGCVKPLAGSGYTGKDGTFSCVALCAKGRFWSGMPTRQAQHRERRRVPFVRPR